MVGVLSNERFKHGPGLLCESRIEQRAAKVELVGFEALVNGLLDIGVGRLEIAEVDQVS